MHDRTARRLGAAVSEIGFGTWAIGGNWGEAVDESAAEAALNAALESGVSFIDTANVYGGGRSETIVGRVLKARGGKPPFVATKAGLGGENVLENYSRENLARSIEGSLARLQTDALDLLQLHTPPVQVYYMPEVFDTLDALVKDGKLRRYGVSVRKVEEGLKAIEYPGVASVQIVYNIFRQRPERLLFSEAARRGVAVIARLPLASGMLSGRMTADTAFAPGDHRAFNRHGERFDVGETFSGVPFETGLAAVEELRPLVPRGATMAQFALRWILMNVAVTVVIPGAKSAEQAVANSAAGALAPLSSATMATARSVYDQHIARYVDQRW